MMKPLLFLFLLVLPGVAEWRAGVARVQITPQLPVWLTGFAARTRPSTSVAQDLYAKALAIEDDKGERFVIITADLIGFTNEITAEVMQKVGAQQNLKRGQLLFNASHTHSGPSIWPRLHVAPSGGPEIDAELRRYADALVPKLAGVISEALRNLQPATLGFGEGQAGFATNRRLTHLAGIRPGETFPGPTDHSVPVLRVATPDGRILAILFGYACHNTVLTSEFVDVSGDYAGHAQEALEKHFPGATALFITLCAGDQGAAPRSKAELAVKHGQELAGGVVKGLASKVRPMRGQMRYSYEEITLPFTVHTREAYAGEASSGDYFMARRGLRMLKALESGKPIVSAQYPVQAVRFGDGPAWLALAGEVVIDYQISLKREYGSDKVVVAGYSNDLPGYIPSRRVQREGGYEAGDSLMYFQQPGWWTDQVEELVLSAARRNLDKVGLSRR